MDEPQIPYDHIKETALLYKVPLILGSLGVLIIIIGLFLLFRNPQPSVVFSTDEASTSGQPIKDIMVDVQGAVANPGVYSLPGNSRVADAIAKAGGLSASADNAWIAQNMNQAQKISDGSKLYIPAEGEKVAVTTTQNFGIVAGTSSNTSNATGIININTASSGELEKLYRVGPATAEKIITNRPYQTIEELLSKKILGQAVFDQIKAEITVQ